MKKTSLPLLLACLACLLLAGACSSLNSTKPNLLGVVKLGPFPRQAAWCGGYNLYFGAKAKGPFQRINDDPVAGGSSLEVPYLKPGSVYYFYMTAVSRRDPRREGRPGALFARRAAQSWN